MRAVIQNRVAALKAAVPAQRFQSGHAAVCAVRQPVFDADEELVGHRLLAATGDSCSPGGYLATMPAGEDAELVLGEEFHAVSPRGLVFLSVSRQELLERRALSLPQARVVLCLQAVKSLDEDLRDAIDRHAMRGFQFALVGAGSAAVDRALLERAETVIVDVGTHAPSQLEGLVTFLRHRVGPRRLVATGVDSRTSFQTCRRLGFEMFEGQFYLRPTPGPTRTVAEVGLSGFGTMAELVSTDDFEQLGAIITRDPGLSMRLLRYANSAHTALPRSVGSVHEALAWLGTVAVREFALISTLASVPEAPNEMLVTALTRARMCQQLGRRLPATDPEESFTVGLFSVAEAVTNAPIDAVLRELPLRADIAAALVNGEGELGRLLEAVIAYEQGDFAPGMMLTGAPELTAQTYLESMRWADSAVKAVG